MSTTTKFTPGPWLVFDHYCGRDPETAGEYAEHRLIGLSQFDTVADVRHGHDEIEGDVDTNARLIAAAPDMFEALEGIEHFSDALNYRDDTLSVELRKWINAGRAALAKARGEG